MVIKIFEECIIKVVKLKKWNFSSCRIGVAMQFENLSEYNWVCDKNEICRVKEMKFTKF